MHEHVIGVTQCPGCACKDETLGHMLRCPNCLMDKKRREILHSMRKKGLRSQVAERVMEVYCPLPKHYVTEGSRGPLQDIQHRARLFTNR